LAKFVDESKVVFADLPGIIEGAHLNKGLGHQFLQHAERTKCLLYVIDGTTEGDGRSPLKDYQVLYNELKMYKNGVLLEKPSLIAVNKMDRKYTDFKEKFARLKRQAHCPIIPISAQEGLNLETLLETIKETVDVEADRE
jgi:GTPase